MANALLADMNCNWEENNIELLPFTRPNNGVGGRILLSPVEPPESFLCEEHYESGRDMIAS